MRPNHVYSTTKEPLSQVQLLRTADSGISQFLAGRGHGSTIIKVLRDEPRAASIRIVLPGVGDVRGSRTPRFIGVWDRMVEPAVSATSREAFLSKSKEVTRKWPASIRRRKPNAVHVCMLTFSARAQAEAVIFQGPGLRVPKVFGRHHRLRPVPDPP